MRTIEEFGKASLLGIVIAACGIFGVGAPVAAKANSPGIVSPADVWICVTSPAGIACWPVPPPPQSPVIVV